MRLVVQRVREASVQVDEHCVASINTGLLALVGFGREDGPDLPGSVVWKSMLDKLLHTRIFPGKAPDKADKMDLDVVDFGGEILLVSQFTLYADCRKGRRPGFQDAAAPDLALRLFEAWVRDVDARLPHRVGSGSFGALMEVRLNNWGPVTLVLDSTQLFPGLYAHDQEPDRA